MSMHDTDASLNDAMYPSSSMSVPSTTDPGVEISSSSDPSLPSDDKVISLSKTSTTVSSGNLPVAYVTDKASPGFNRSIRPNGAAAPVNPTKTMTLVHSPVKRWNIHVTGGYNVLRLDPNNLVFPSSGQKGTILSVPVSGLPTRPRIIHRSPVLTSSVPRPNGTVIKPNGVLPRPSAISPASSRTIILRTPVNGPVEKQPVMRYPSFGPTPAPVPKITPALPKPPATSPTDKETPEKRRVTRYAFLKKKFHSASGRQTRTVLSSTPKVSQDMFYAVTAKDTAFKATQNATKLWNSSTFGNGIPAIFTKKTFPAHYHEQLMTPKKLPYKGRVSDIIDDLLPKLNESIKVNPNVDITASSNSSSVPVTLNKPKLEPQLTPLIQKEKDLIDMLREHINLNNAVTLASAPKHVLPSRMTMGLRIKKRSQVDPDIELSTITRLSQAGPISMIRAKELATVSLTGRVVPHPVSPESEEVPAEEDIQSQKRRKSNNDLSEDVVVKESKSHKRKHSGNDFGTIKKKRKVENGDDDDSPIVVEGTEVKAEKHLHRDKFGRFHKKSEHRRKKHEERRLKSRERKRSESFDFDRYDSDSSERRLAKNPVKFSAPAKYRPIASIKTHEELNGEYLSPEDVATLKFRRKTVKNIRKKTKNFGVFCEKPWFRKRLKDRVVDEPILMQAPKPTAKGNISKKSVIEYENFSRKASLFRYAPIPIPDDIVMRPEASPYKGIIPVNYHEIFQQYLKELTKAHQSQAKRDTDYHWQEYLPENQKKVNHPFANVKKWFKFENGFTKLSPSPDTDSSSSSTVSKSSTKDDRTDGISRNSEINFLKMNGFNGFVEREHSSSSTTESYGNNDKEEDELCSSTKIEFKANISLNGIKNPQNRNSVESDLDGEFETKISKPGDIIDEYEELSPSGKVVIEDILSCDFINTDTPSPDSPKIGFPETNTKDPEPSQTPVIPTVPNSASNGSFSTTGYNSANSSTPETWLKNGVEFQGKVPRFVETQ